jgi:hypothetical protein
MPCLSGGLFLSINAGSKTVKEFALNYSGGGYGSWFNAWIYFDNPNLYNCFGNGSAMRVSLFGKASNSLEISMEEAGKAQL